MQIYKSLYYLLEVRQYFFGKTRVGAAKHRLFFVYIDTIIPDTYFVKAFLQFNVYNILLLYIKNCI